MKNYREKQYYHRESRTAKERYTKSTLQIDVSTKNKPANKHKKDNLHNGTEKQRKVTPSFMSALGPACNGHQQPISKHLGHGHNQNELLRLTHNHDELIRPSSCQCPHGHHHDEEVRPASCPYGHKYDKKQPRASYTCTFGYSHGTIINHYPRQTPINRNKATSEHAHSRKRRFYGINIPQEPLIQMPAIIYSQYYKENSQDVQPRPWSIAQRKRVIPFSKSYKNVCYDVQEKDSSPVVQSSKTLKERNQASAKIRVGRSALQLLLKVSNSNANKCGVWMDAGIHAREWIGPAVNTYVANYIASHFKSLPTFITNKDWFFLPVANPDGYEYSHTTDRMWRKNKAHVNGKCVGVDLNRNFSFGWGGQGSSDNPQNNFYRGTKPFSEPESCAIRDFISSGSKRFRLYITLHSYGEVIIFPYADNDTLCPGYIRLLEGATVMSRAFFAPGRGGGQE